MYYRLYDLQCGRYMYTGYNCDLKGLVEAYRSYIAIDDIEDHSSLSDEDMLNVIKANEFEIESSDTLFDKNDLEI